MNPIFKTLRAALLIAALATLPLAGYAADPATPRDNGAAATQPSHQDGAPAAVTPTPETPLHEVGASAPDAPPTPTAPVGAAAPAAAPGVWHHGGGDDGNNRVSVGGSTYVGPDETVVGNAVAVMGPVTVDGAVDGNAVAVLGSNTINGAVHGNCVAVLGVLKLGPNARVDGNAVCVGGKVVKAPGAFVAGNIVNEAQGLNFADDSAAYSWWNHGLRLGRPLAIGPNLHFLWIFTLCQIALYVLFALVFPNGVTKCGETLAQRPGITFLTGILAILGLPFLFILLLVTVVGIPVAILILPLSVMAAVMFGKSAIYAFIGRAILGKQLHPALAVLVGVAIMVALYFVPFVGLALWFLVAFLGFATAVTTLFTSSRSARPAAPVPPVVVAPSPVMAAAAPMPQETASAQPQPPVAEPVPPVVSTSAVHVSEAALPRAGFWIRMVALLIDLILVGIVTQVHHLFLPALAIYGAVLWKLRGATIGDIIFGLKVVRMDGSQLDWVTVIVRALACFFSLIIVGLGFFWIAFDSEKQGWHDKIAGTVVVKLPKGTSLI